MSVTPETNPRIWTGLHVGPVPPPPETPETPPPEAPEAPPPEVFVEAGAEATFVGRTRLETHPAHGALQHLDYHAYPAMAEAQLRQLGERVLGEHGLWGVRIVHATGAVAVGEASVVVQCWAGHRDAAFAGCRDAIDSLKATLPIWKREVWADGTTFQDGVAVAAETVGAAGSSPKSESVSKSAAASNNACEVDKVGGVGGVGG